MSSTKVKKKEKSNELKESKEVKGQSKESKQMWMDFLQKKERVNLLKKSWSSNNPRKDYQSKLKELSKEYNANKKTT
jgi:hypothetical protein